MPVGEHAILEIIIRQLLACGVTKITLAVNHMSDIIMAFVGDGKKFGVEIAYSFEDKPLSTVGPIKMISGLPEHFLVMNGDILTDLPSADLYARHLNAGVDLTVAVYQRDTRIDFGVLEVDRTVNRVIGFREKPTYHFDVSMGIYAFSHTLLERVPPNKAYGFDALVLGMLRDKRPIQVYPYDGYWLDIGRPDDYDQANQDVDKLQHLIKERANGMEDTSNRT